MVIITDADTDKKKTNSLVPIPMDRYRYEKFLDTNADTVAINFFNNLP